MATPSRVGGGGGGRMREGVEERCARFPFREHETGDPCPCPHPGPLGPPLESRNKRLFHVNFNLKAL